jgi:hypothetical protein
VKETRFEAVSSIQQSLRRYGKKGFLGHSICGVTEANAVVKRSGTILGDSTNKNFLYFFSG